MSTKWRFLRLLSFFGFSKCPLILTHGRTKTLRNTAEMSAKLSFGERKNCAKIVLWFYQPFQRNITKRWFCLSVGCVNHFETMLLTAIYSLTAISLLTWNGTERRSVAGYLMYLRYLESVVSLLIPLVILSRWNQMTTEIVSTFPVNLVTKKWLTLLTANMVNTAHW